MRTTQLKTLFGIAVMVGIASTGATAQTAAPGHEADPSVYKVIFEDANFRVTEANRGPGVHDKVHGHPLISIVYYVTDCSSKVYEADGKVREGAGKAGTARASSVTASHSVENVSRANCKQIFIERK